MSDLLLQSLGLTAFLLPFWMGGVGVGHGCARVPAVRRWLRWVGNVLSLVFLPAVFGLLPWHWRWMHAVPIEGVMGRLMAGCWWLYLNIQGAWLVAGVLAARALLCFGGQLLGASGEHRGALADAGFTARPLAELARRARRAAAEQKPMDDRQSTPMAPSAALCLRSAGPARNSEPEAPAGASAACIAVRSRKRPEVDPLDEIPAFQRAIAVRPDEAQRFQSRAAPQASIWERTRRCCGRDRAC